MTFKPGQYYHYPVDDKEGYAKILSVSNNRIVYSWNYNGGETKGNREYMESGDITKWTLVRNKSKLLKLKLQGMLP